MKTLIGGTEKGLTHNTNQDCFELARLSDTLAFAILCDGMGGESGGDIASRTAVAHAREALLRDLGEGMNEVTLRRVMLAAVTGANAVVHDIAVKDPSLTRMGTTMIVAVFSQGVLYAASVGDSRVYCVTPQEERQISRDHTLVQMLLDIGEISEADARSHPKRHFITRAVGVSDTVDVDFLVQPLAPEEFVLICSDGLYNFLPPGKVYTLLRHCLQEQDVRSLIDLALDAGSTDDITAIVAC